MHQSGLKAWSQKVAWWVKYQRSWILFLWAIQGLLGRHSTPSLFQRDHSLQPSLYYCTWFCFGYLLFFVSFVFGPHPVMFWELVVVVAPRRFSGDCCRDGGMNLEPCTPAHQGAVYLFIFIKTFQPKPAPLSHNCVSAVIGVHYIHAQEFC